MVLRAVESVALAAFLPRNLVNSIGRPISKRSHSTTASQVNAVVEGDHSGVQAPQGPCTHFLELEPHQPLARC